MTRRSGLPRRQQEGANMAAPCGRDKLGPRAGRRRGAKSPVLTPVWERRSSPVVSAGRVRHGPV